MHVKARIHIARSPLYVYVIALVSFYVSVRLQYVVWFLCTHAVGGLLLTVSSMDKGALSQGADIEAYFASIPLVLSADTETIILQHPHLNEALSEFRRLILQIHAVNHVNFRTIIDDFRLGHYDDHQLVTERVNPPVGLELLKRVSHRLSYKQFACIDCYMKKIKAHPRVMKSSKINTHSPMANGHVDVIGPFLAHGHGGKKFAYLYICDDSSYVRLAWTKEHMTDLAVPVIQGWRFEANERGWAMHKIHFDSDPVFKSEQFRDQLAAMDIGTRYAPPGQHWVNGLMERFIQTICHNGYAMLRASGLPEKYFPFALSYATWLHNQHYRLRAVNASNPSYVGKVPYEVVHQRKYTGPRPALGQAVIARHSNPQQLAKLDDRGRLCAFLGIDELSHETLILLHLATGVVITSGDFHVLPNLYAWTMKPIVMDGKSTTIGSDTNFPREAMALSDELQHSMLNPPRASANLLPASADKVNGLDDDQTELTDRKRRLQQADKALLRGPPDKARHLQDDSLFNDNKESEAANNPGIRQSRRLQHLPPPDDVVTTCLTTIARYYDHFSAFLHDPAHLVNTPKLITTLPDKEKNRNVLNTFVTTRYLPVSFYERGLSEEEADHEIRQATSNMEKPDLCLAFAVQATGRLKAALVDFQDGAGAIMVLLPQNPKEAKASPYWQTIWKPAMDREVASFIKRGCFDVPTYRLPEGMLPIKTKWIYDVKTGPATTFLKGKARLVSKGFSMRYMIHYTETYSPCAHIESLRLVIYLVVALNFYEFTIDIEVAFLNDPPDTTVYYEYPEGFPDQDPFRKQWARGLTNIYGNPDSGRIFWQRQIPRLRAAGYTPTLSDPGLLWHRNAANLLTVCDLHVDNFTFASQDPCEQARITAIMCKHYTIEVDSKITRVMGMTLHRDTNGDAIMYGPGYYQEVAEQLGLVHLKPAKSMGNPLIHYQPNTTGKASKEMISFYRSLTGSMLFPSRMWRPDTAYRVRALAAFTSNPSFEHVDAMIQILRYCVSTETLGIKFSKPTVPIPAPLIPHGEDIQLEIMLMADADWSKEFDYKSVSGTCMRICTISELKHGIQTGDWPDYNYLNWRSKKQASFVADSTEASETMASCVGTRDVMFQRNVLEELGILARNSQGVLLNDNKALIVNLNNGKCTTNMRHYGRNIAFLLQQMDLGTIIVHWIATSLNCANQMTKSLPPSETTREASRLMGRAKWPPG